MKNLNKHLRIFEITSGKTLKITPKLQKQVFPISTPFNPDHYQRQTRFNRSTDPSLLAIASTSGDLSVVSFPTLDTLYSTKADGEIYSLDFSPADNDTVIALVSQLMVDFIHHPHHPANSPLPRFQASSSAKQEKIPGSAHCGISILPLSSFDTISISLCAVHQSRQSLLCIE